MIKYSIKTGVRLLFAAMTAASVQAQTLTPLTAANPNIAQVRPEAVVPLLKTAPTLDGVISPGEWNTLHVGRFVSQQGDFLSDRLGEYWVGSDGKTLFIAIRTAVHPQAGVQAKIKPRADGGDVAGDLIYDDCIELWVDNQQEGKAGQFFQIMFNPLGATYDASFSRTERIMEKFWNSGIQQAHKVESGLWTAELAIPLAKLGIPEDSPQIGVRVARNWKLPWDQARSEPQVRSFDTLENMSRIRFAATAPVVSETGWQNATGIELAVELANPTAAPLPVTVKLGYNAIQQPRYYDTKTVTLAPGETRHFAYAKELFTPDNYTALGEILVMGEGEAVFYHRDFKWNTKPNTAKIWDATGPKKPDEAVQFQIGYYPSYRLLRWSGEFASLEGAKDVKKMRVEIVSAEPANAKPVAQGEVVPKVCCAEGQIELPPLADGQYDARLFLEGAPNGDKPFKTVRFRHIENFPWKNNAIGLSDVIIPPFTPLTVKKKTIGVIGRDAEMSNAGLWRQVTSLGKPLLAEGMQLRDAAGGAVKGTLRITEQKPTRVVTVADWNTGGLTGRTTSEWDYDGMMKVTLELFGSEAKPGKTGGLDLLIPIRDTEAPFMHVCGEGLRSNYGGSVPTGEGEVWNSTKASRERLLGSFIPYIYLGGEERGLVWFASNDRDWILDESGKTPALALERKKGVLQLRVRLAQQPAVLTRNHKIVFGLQATPVKPMPEKWRQFSFAGGGPLDTFVLGMSMYWGADLYSTFPRNRDYTLLEKIAQAKKEGARDDAFFANYMAANPDIKNEINCAAGAGKGIKWIIPYTNLRGEITSTLDYDVYQDEWRFRYLPDWRQAEPTKGSLDFVMTPVRSRQDYLLWNYREILQHGFDGIYWDNICIYDNESPVTGNGYRRADGTWQTDTDIWQLRELTWRTAVMFHELGKPNRTMPHMTNANLVPVFAWTTLSLDWEWRYGTLDFQDRFTRDYIRAASLCRTTGNAPVILQGITEVQNPVQQAWVERTRIAVTVPHEIAIWQPDALAMRLRNALVEIGYGVDAEVFNYWDANPVVKIEGVDAVWLVVKGHDKAGKPSVMVVLGDYGNGGTATVVLDVKRLGLSKTFTAENWENPADKGVGQHGRVTLPTLKKHDFRVIRITPEAK
jgi:hypothetical protein